MTKKNIYLITGTSRGIGEGIAEALLAPNNHLICFSRSINHDLRQKAKTAGVELDYNTIDLSKPAQSAELFREILEDIAPESIASITLIHNAGALEPLAPVGREKDLSKIGQSLNVNLTTPIVTSEVFVSVVQNWAIDKKILLISSGAGIHPYHAWSMYCSAKAGLEMFARCLSLEQSTEDQPVKVVALAPGVVDTSMQDFLRTLSEDTFHQVQRFKDLKANDQLWSPAFVGGEIRKLLERPDFGSEVRLDLRDLV
ncbi:MAG: SDR family NAD(P)-dependent oxidoreductase [Bacteroidetes bacterium]|nr:SDR family NAD(P)-dependent oxidoreductase [Bacteroidota bacterium]